MKKYKLLTLFIAGILVFSFRTTAQDKANRPSPPAQVTAAVGGAKVTIDYSRPSAKGRKVFGGLVNYGEVWRTGANESTWIEVSEDVKVEGKQLKKGKYSLFTIPGEDTWTIIFNKKWEDWGAYDYDSSQDAIRVTSSPNNNASMTEMFTIDISDNGEVSLAWDKTEVKFTISK